MHDIIQGNCLEVLTQLEDNSIDAIVTDPPYELGFMGKSWDNTGIANNKEMWAECLRVLKPGGHLLAFSGTRTYHRMASAIEDAGFEVRDMIEWVYSTGFPKSLNISKAINKMDGVEFDSKPASGVGFMNNETEDGYHPTINQLVQKGESSERAKEYEGWGTALKPAHEPICMARKPLSEKNVAENCLKWGTGGINIDDSRVDYNGETPNIGGRANHTRGDGYGFKELKENINPNTTGRFPANLIHDNSEEVKECFPETKQGSDKPRNRNTIGSFGMPNDTTPEYRDSGNASRFFKSIIYQAKASKSERNQGCEDLNTTEKFTAGNYSQSPTCKDCEKTLNGTNDHSKCSGEVYYKEMESKNTKNNHPTVKPIALMEYLIKMVTPKGGVVLDPFAGSGSTLVAAKQNGFQYVGIELDKDYCIIAESRLKQKTLKQEVLF